MLTYPGFDPVAFSLGPLHVRWYGLTYLVAFGVAWWLARRRAAQPGSTWSALDVDDLVFFSMLGTILGGRIGYVLFYGMGFWAQDPWYPLRITEGGMSFHGGLIGVLVALAVFAIRRKRHIADVFDFAAALPGIGIFAVRVGNFINGELYGRPVEAAWAVKFPKELYEAPVETQREVLGRAQEFFSGPAGLDDVVSSVPGSSELAGMVGEYLTPRHPSQIYEALLEGALLFVILWLVRTKVRVPNGVITGLFFVGYALTRSLAESFRFPDAGYVGLLTRGQFLSVFLLLIGVGFLVAAWRRPVYPPAWAGRG